MYSVQGHFSPFVIVAAMLACLVYNTYVQDTLRGRHTIIEKLLGVLDRTLHHLLSMELESDFVETTNVIPGDCGHFDSSLVNVRTSWKQ